MTTHEPWEVKLAWQIALQARGCPPDSILHGEAVDEQLSAHLSQCPFCSESRDLGPDSFEESALAREITRRAGPHPAREPLPGQVCLISRRLAGWGPKGRFYNPLPVLVLEHPRDMPGAARVAPVYDDLRLAGPGDVALKNGFFAEAWNTFTVRLEDLECCCDTIEEEERQEVLDAESVEWGNPAEGTPLEAFRRLEVEVAAFFALQALGGLMDRRELGPLGELAALFPDGASLKLSLSDDYPDVEWSEGPMDAAEALARARFPRTGLAMAAAGEAELVSGNVAVIRGDALDLQPTLCEIRHYSPQGDGLVVGGRVLSPLAGRVELYGQWVKEGLPPRDCDQSFIDVNTGFFRIMFRNMLEDEFKSGRLFLLVAGSTQP